MSDSIPSPRWTLVVRPSTAKDPLDASPDNSLEVHAEGVTHGELANVLMKLVVSTMRNPGNVLPTTLQVEAWKAEQALIKDNPATVIYVRNGEQAWLGEAALVSDQETDATLADVLAVHGWIHAGAVPEGVVKACEYARNPETLLEKIQRVIQKTVEAPIAEC